jgi:hypothetical protein
MIDVENIYFSDVSLCAFLLYCTRNLKENECEVAIEKLKDDLLIDKSEFSRLMKTVRAEKSVCESSNIDDVLALRNYKLRMKFSKSFLSKLEEVRVAEKKGKDMIKRVNQSTFVFCGTLTEREKELQNLLEDYIESEEKKKPQQKKAEVIVSTPTMSRQELSLYFRQQKEEKERKKLLRQAIVEDISNEISTSTNTDTDDDFDADEFLPDELFF